MQMKKRSKNYVCTSTFRGWGNEQERLEKARPEIQEENEAHVVSWKANEEIVSRKKQFY